MKFLEKTQSICLKGNRIDDRGASEILNNLIDRVRVINLDNNQITSHGLTNLAKWVDNMNIRCQLEELTLEGNKICDEFVIGFAEILLRAQPPLKTLNLSKNQIADKGACALAEFIAAHYHLKVFKISWNKISGKGGIALAEAL